MTPSHVSKMKRTVNQCWHNCGGHGSLTHLLWDCPAVRTFWSGVVKVQTEMLEVQEPVCPITCLFGQRLEHIKSKSVHRLLDLGFLSAKRIILMNWRVRKSSCFALCRWNRDYLDLLSMERVTNLLLDFDKGMQGHWDIARAFNA